MTRQKKVTLCGKEVTLSLRNCHICEESCWFENNVFVCNECSEIHILPPASRHAVLRSEYEYNGDYTNQVSDDGITQIEEDQ